MPAIIARVTDVQPHPSSDKPLDVITVNNMINVADRPTPNEPRYKVGDYVVVLEPNLILPEWLLRHNHLWDDSKGKGRLGGSKGNRTKTVKIAGVPSEVALFKVHVTNMLWFERDPAVDYPVEHVYGLVRTDPAGEDVAHWLQVKEYQPA